jgi:hypothetical protein
LEDLPGIGERHSEQTSLELGKDTINWKTRNHSIPPPIIVICFNKVIKLNIWVFILQRKREKENAREVRTAMHKTKQKIKMRKIVKQRKHRTLALNLCIDATKTDKRGIKQQV